MTWEWDAARNFDEHADLTGDIMRVLATANPTVTLHELWPWVALSARLRFVEQAVPLQNSGNGGELELLVQRFAHQVRAAWAERYVQQVPPDMPSWRARLRARITLWRRG